MEDDAARIAAISAEILEFIDMNPGACDAQRGIEKCWLQRMRYAAPRLIEQALASLVAGEQLRRIDMLGGAPLYAAPLRVPTESFTASHPRAAHSSVITRGTRP